MVTGSCGQRGTQRLQVVHNFHTVRKYGAELMTRIKTKALSCIFPLSVCYTCSTLKQSPYKTDCCCTYAKIPHNDNPKQLTAVPVSSNVSSWLKVSKPRSTPHTDWLVRRAAPSKSGLFILSSSATQYIRHEDASLLGCRLVNCYHTA